MIKKKKEKIFLKNYIKLIKHAVMSFTAVKERGAYIYYVHSGATSNIDQIISKIYSY